MGKGRKKKRKEDGLLLKDPDGEEMLVTKTWKKGKRRVEPKGNTILSKG